MYSVIIPERRSSFDDKYDNFYIKTLPNNVREYYSKDFYNKDFTRKFNDDDVFEKIKKEIILQQIEDALKD
jgi:hypothetical protein